MDIRPSPLPGWAWDLIETVERGERKPDLVREIVWRPAHRGPWSKMLAHARSGSIKSDPDTLARAIDQWEVSRAAANHDSSGHASQRRHVITINAGTSETDQRMVLLHELAHLLTPCGIYHERPWVRIVARLYIKYGGPEIVDWAYHHERRGGDALKRRLPHDHASCGTRAVMGAVKGLVADLNAIEGVSASVSYR